MPARKYFYSSTKNGKIVDDGKISDGHISVKDYLTYEKIWDKFKMKNMSDHYLKKDVLLSGDVLEKFIETCLRYYGLDPCHYLCDVKNGWFKIRKKTSGIGKYLSIEKELRGGISYIAKRYAKANNKFNDYDRKKSSTSITYLDMSNLYG